MLVVLHFRLYTLRDRASPAAVGWAQIGLNRTMQIELSMLLVKLAGDQGNKMSSRN